MRSHRRGSWIETRRELGQVAWAVMLIDLIAIGLGALASRPMGPMALKFGLVLAGVVTVSFTLMIAANLAIEAGANWWLTRRAGSHAAGRAAGRGGVRW